MMNESQKLDRILHILDKQQQETYIPSKWKPLIDYLERTGREPLQVVEAFIKLDQVFEDRDKRIKKETT